MTKVAKLAITILTLSGLWATINLLVPMTPAFAASCSTEQQILVNDTQINSNYGTQAAIYIRNHDLDSQCGDAATWSMVLSWDPNGNDWAETGYRDWLALVETWSVQSCWGINNAETCDYPRNVSRATWASFKIANYPVGSSTWPSWIDTGSGWSQTDSGQDSFSAALTVGETSKHGDNTGMLDHKRSLEWKSHNNSWHLWGAMAKKTQKYASGWYFHPMGNNEYEICRSGGQCPWQ